MRQLIGDMFNAHIIKVIGLGNDNQDGWQLSSGGWSPIYINLREIGKEPKIYSSVIYEMSRQIKVDTPQSTTLVGIPTMGVPLSAAIALASSRRLAIIRQNHKEDLDRVYEGMHGKPTPGQPVILIDDVLTTGNSAYAIIQTLRLEGILSSDIKGLYVVVDRTNGRTQIPQYSAAPNLIPNQSLFTMTDIIKYLMDTLVREESTVAALEAYNQAPSIFKNASDYWRFKYNYLRNEYGDHSPKSEGT